MRNNRLHPSVVTLALVGALFLPAIPAYLWLWPRLAGSSKDFAQALSYLYMLGGTVVIALRRYPWSAMALNRKGWRLSLLCGAALLLGRVLVTLSVRWPPGEESLTWLGLAGEALFYFGLVGLTEELLFRGLVYHALEEWRGVRWAIWGSTLLFALYHVPGQGPLGGIGTFINGLILAAIRWRSGSISGLIIVHGIIDIVGVHLIPNTDISSWGRPEIVSPASLVIGLLLMLAVPLYLWKIHPLIARRLRPTGSSSIPA